jgi:hypothetical protein
MYTTRQSPHRKAEMTLVSAGLGARATGACIRGYLGFSLGSRM